MTQSTKLACNSIWKVYGENPAKFFNREESPESRRDRIVSEGHLPAACDVSFEVEKGEIFVIMGLSGSGKSTVVRCLSRLVEPSAGQVLLDGENLLEKSSTELIEIRRHRLGMVFQHFGLLPHQTVLENVAFPLKVQGVNRSERESRACKMIELVGLEGRESHYPRELSGGQQQRVGIARSLADDPEIWLLDEPFSALDPLIRRQMQDEFLRLQKLLHKTIIFITHDFLEALKLADRIAIMKDGWIVQIGAPTELVSHPANDYVAEFTRDVPRLKIITAGEVLKNCENVSQSRNLSNSTITSNSTLESLLPDLAGSANGLTVIDGDKKVLGSITMRDVIHTLASSNDQ
jgi:glycine betaine/proline transport system ATP-binding protein